MKHHLIAILLLISTTSIHSQGIRGQWRGILDVSGTKLTVILNIDSSANGFKVTMDSPDQGAKGIPASKATFSHPKFEFAIASAGIEYAGDYQGDMIKGTFNQGGARFPLNFQRAVTPDVPKRRPQEPKPPYAYHSEEVKFDNPRAGLTLSGTLTRPKGISNYPTVILISGSGAQNRDEEIMGHKPFLVIADYLTNRGIAVLRYDDRGVGKSTGIFSAATSEDFASDVESAIAYLKTRSDINKKKIGLIGHSEGGLIAPMVAGRSKDVDFMVLLAGPGLRGDKLLLLQQELILKASGVPAAEIEKVRRVNADLFSRVLENKPGLESDLREYLAKELKAAANSSNANDSAVISAELKKIFNPWMLFFLKHDPAPVFEKLKTPVLVLNGSIDLQVPAVENTQAIAYALKKAGNKKARIKILPGLNHLFQTGKTGAPSEYAGIPETFSPIALMEIESWIKQQTKSRSFGIIKK